MVNANNKKNEDLEVITDEELQFLLEADIDAVAFRMTEAGRYIP